MSLYVPTGTPPLITNAMARIERRLPHPGEVLVRVGQRVEPEVTVARAFIPGTPQIVNLARALMIAPSMVERAMVREVGNKVAQGEVLARSSRFGGRVCLAPVSGIIVALDRETGYVTISPDPTEYSLPANIRGLVMDVTPGRGVQIETPAAQMYGAYGFGEERSGVLLLAATDPSEVISPERITPVYAYSIIIAGKSISAAALRQAVKKQVRGIIVGGIDEQELRTFLQWASTANWRPNKSNWKLTGGDSVEPVPDLTLVVTEGFGERPMSQPLFELLASHAGQEALIDGSMRLRSPLQRPRVVIPLSARTSDIQLELPRATLRAGATVRLLDADHLGQVGRVRQISTFPRRLDSHVRTQAVEVLLEDGSTLWLPRTAIELLN
jgi:hypothetical protein